MSTLVIQSFRTTDVPDWIARCLASVQAWTRAQGYAYQFADDASFALCPPAYLERAKGNLRTITNLTRLILARRALGDGGFARAIWLDADQFVFAPEQFVVPAGPRYAFARETWLRPLDEGSAPRRWRAHDGVNNSAFVFTRGEPDLDFLIQATLHVALHRQVRTNYQVGGELLKGLRTSLEMTTLETVGMFSPWVVKALAAGEEPLLRAQARYHGWPVFAANLCASPNYVAEAAAQETHAAMDALERSRGEVVNRWLADGPLKALPYPGYTAFELETPDET